MKNYVFKNFMIIILGWLIYPFPTFFGILELYWNIVAIFNKMGFKVAQSIFFKFYANDPKLKTLSNQIFKKLAILIISKKCKIYETGLSFKIVCKTIA